MSCQSTIAIGPLIHRPSWDWAGFDSGRELSKYFNVVFFNREDKRVPDCDLVFFVKQKPPLNLWKDAILRSLKIVYSPVDYYKSRSSIRADASFLKSCAAIFIHCERLQNHFTPYTRVDFVEHHNRFGLAKAEPYRKNGYAVWVGGRQYLPNVVRWLQKHPLGMEIKFVTDFAPEWHNHARIGLPIEDEHQVIAWEPVVQRDIMAGAKVAFDIKGSDFNQKHKPPVKAQMFIASGIPFATNQGSAPAEYFAKRGFRVASLLEPDRWMSFDYWQQTQTVAGQLRKRLTLVEVGRHYRDLLDSIIDST